MSEPDRRAASTTISARAPREMFGARHRPRHHFADQHAALADCRMQGFVLRRVDDIEPARQHGDGAAVQRCFVSRLVDAARQAGHDNVVHEADLGRQLPGELAPDGGGISR